MRNPSKRVNEGSAFYVTAKNMKLFEEDHLSSLFDDCLMDIFSRLNHDDLDEMATVSEKMSIFAGLSRSKAVKVHAKEIQIIQETNEQLYIKILTGKGSFFVDNSNQYVALERMKRCNEDFKMEDVINWNVRPEKQAISKKVVDRAISLLDRFDFATFRLHKVSIDDHIVRFIQQISFSRAFNIFKAKRCGVDDNLTSDGRARFLSTLLSAKPTQLWLCCAFLRINERFIADYVDNVPCPTLILGDKAPLVASATFKHTLSKIKTIIAPLIRIDAGCIIPAILDRLRMKMMGRWTLLLTRELSQAEIQANLPTDFEYNFEYDDDGTMLHIVRFERTMDMAKIKIDRFYEAWKLILTFN